MPATPAHVPLTFPQARRIPARQLTGPLGLLLLAGACNQTPDASPTPSAPVERLTLTSNFQVGGLALLRSDGSVTAPPTVLHGDAVAREALGLLFVVNRLGGDNIQVLDPTANFATLQQFSVGVGSNPQDIAVLSAEQAFVAAYNRSALLAFNPTTGEALGELDLSSFAQGDPDGAPEISSVLVVEGQLLVAIQRLERTSSGYIPLDDSYLVKVDPLTGGVQNTLRLAFPNPVGLLRRGADGLLRVPLSGRFGTVGDGGVELIEPVSLTSQGVLVDETTLGGDILAVAGSSPLWILLGQDSVGAEAHTLLVSWQDAQQQTWLESEGWHLWDVEQDASGSVWCTDRSLKAPGLWQVSSTLTTPTFIPFGAGLLPPTWWGG